MLFAHCLYVVCTVAPPTSEPELQLLHSSKISAAVKLFRHHVQTSLHSSSAFLSHVFNAEVLLVLQSVKKFNSAADIYKCFEIISTSLELFMKDLETLQKA